MNREYILKRIKPYLNNKGMLGEEDFNNIFYMLNKKQKYDVINILIEENIDIDYENISKSTPRSTEPQENTSLDILKLNKLTNEQLCVIYQQGNKLALDAIINKNTKLVWSRVIKFAKRYNHKLDQEDLLQHGLIGLMRAAQLFDVRQEAKLTTYSTWWIDQHIHRAIIDYGFTVRFPVHYFEQISKVMRILSKYPDATKQQKLNIAIEMGIGEEKFEEILLNIRNIVSLTYLNTFVGEGDDSELADFIVDDITPSVEEQVENNILKETLGMVLDTLTNREKNVLELRFGLRDGRERTLEQVGVQYDVTRERIRQIEAKALRKLRHPVRSKKLKDFI